MTANAWMTPLYCALNGLSKRDKRNVVLDSIARSEIKRARATGDAYSARVQSDRSTVVPPTPLDPSDRIILITGEDTLKNEASSRRRRLSATSRFHVGRCLFEHPDVLLGRPQVQQE